MKNEASRMYGVNAIRLYVLYDNTVLYEGGVGPTYYSTDEVRKTIIDKTYSCAEVWGRQRVLIETDWAEMNCSGSVVAAPKISWDKGFLLLGFLVLWSNLFSAIFI